MTTLKPNSFAGLPIKFWIIFNTVFLLGVGLPGLLSPMELSLRIILVVISLLPFVYMIFFIVRNFDRSLTLEDDQLTIYEFGKTTVIKFEQIAEVMYTDLHEIPDSYGAIFPAFLKVVTKDNAISFVAATGAWNRKDLKAFYDAFPDHLKTHMDRDRSIVQARMIRNRIGRSGFLDQTKVRNTKLTLLKYAIFFIIVIVALYLFSTYYS